MSIDLKKRYLKYKTKYLMLEDNYFSYNIDESIEDFSQIGGNDKLNKNKDKN